MDVSPCDQLYVDGAWQMPVERSPSITLTSPVTEEIIGAVAAGSSVDVDRAVAAARRAFASFSLTSTDERIALLRNILALMEERFEELAQAISFEMGSAITFSRASQVPFGIAHIRAAIEVLGNYAFLRHPIAVGGGVNADCAFPVPDARQTHGKERRFARAVAG